MPVLVGLGLVLLILGLVFAVHVLFAIGIALAVIGAVLYVVPFGPNRRL